MSEKTVIMSEALVSLHDSIVETAIRNLKEQNELIPVLFAITTGGAMTKEARTILTSAGFAVEPLGDTVEPVGDADLMVLVFPMAMDGGTLYSQLLVIPGAHGPVLRECEETGVKMGLPGKQVRETTVKLFMKQVGAEPKAIQKRFIQSVLTLTHALAYVKLDEAWIVKAPSEPGAAEDMGKTEADVVKKFPNGLADDPRASEAISAFMETHGFSRSVLIPFTRSERGTGKVMTVSAPEVHDTRDGEFKSGGRFSNLLRAVKGTEV